MRCHPKSSLRSAHTLDRFTHGGRSDTREFIAFRRSLGRTALDRTRCACGLDLADGPVLQWRRVPPCCSSTAACSTMRVAGPRSPTRGATESILDQRGRGGEGAPNPLDARIEDDAEDVGAVRRALGIQQWDVWNIRGAAESRLTRHRADLGVRRRPLNSVGQRAHGWTTPRDRAIRLGGELRDG